ncbi:MAG: iron donor protein CyaY [Planctomycetota bacterium]
MIDEASFDKAAAKTLERIVVAFDEVDPDQVEASPSMGVVRLEFGSGRRSWVVNSQRGSLQIWLAAEQRAWHFSGEGDASEPRWVSPKTGEELFQTLSGLLAEHEGLTVSFGA